MQPRFVTRKFVALTIAALIVSVSVSYLIFVNPYSTIFHQEYTLHPKSSFGNFGCIVELLGLETTEVTIGFRDVEKFWYSFDIILYEPTLRSFAYTLEEETDRRITLNATASIKSVDLFLGAHRYYQFVIEGENLTTSIIYGNHVILGAEDYGVWENGYFDYRATGSLSFTLADPLGYSLGGLDVWIGVNGALFPESVYLDIDLPPDLGGVVQFYDPTNVEFTDMVGWFLVDDTGEYVEYSANENSTYWVDIQIKTADAVANLNA